MFSKKLDNQFRKQNMYSASLIVDKKAKKMVKILYLVGIEEIKVQQLLCLFYDVNNINRTNKNFNKNFNLLKQFSEQFCSS